LQFVFICYFIVLDPLDEPNGKQTARDVFIVFKFTAWW